MSSFRFKVRKSIGRPKTAVDLPAPVENLSGFTSYLGAQFNRTTLFLRNPLFANLVGSVDAAYGYFRTREHGVSPGLARLMSVCHQAMFSAASSIARGLPADGHAVTRRAVEAACTALAVSLDRSNADRWLAFEERENRWQKRLDDEKPPSLRLNYSFLDDDSLGKKLGKFKGMLSDSGTHFTPELLGSLSFEEKRGGTLVFSNYLVADDSYIAAELRYFAATHLLILKALLRSCGVTNWEDSSLAPDFGQIADAARALYAKYPFNRRPEIDEELAIS